ncbi:MAG TPA: hypothetical protein VFQ88_15450 [Nevskiaceae bacterium]|nr:hypothetical protein [Nevskiaceae bacterium]
MKLLRSRALVSALTLALGIAVAGIANAQSTLPAPAPAPAPVTAPATSSIANVNSPAAGAMIFDLLLVRPLGLVATALGTGLFIVNLPLSVFEKNAPAQPFQKLVVDPARFTFTRPLGDMR